MFDIQTLMGNTLKVDHALVAMSRQLQRGRGDRGGRGFRGGGPGGRQVDFSSLLGGR